MLSKYLVLFGCGGPAVEVAECILGRQMSRGASSAPVVVSHIVSEGLGRFGNKVQFVHGASKAGGSRRDFVVETEFSGQHSSDRRAERLTTSAR